jgi:hypothetical protein
VAPALIAALAVHGSGLGQYFALDDLGTLARVTGLEPMPWLAPRPLANGVVWVAMHALFGLDPRPWHALLLLLHVGACGVVYAIGLRLLREPWLAGFAATLMAATSIGFAPLRWFSAVSEPMMLCFAGLAALAVLAAADRGRPALGWAGAAAALAAMLSKETAATLPLALLALLWRPGAPRGWWRPAAPSFAAAALFVAAFFLSTRTLPYGGPAYALDLSPGHLVTNLATYLAWGVRLDVPIRDLVASAQPAALPAGIATGAALLLLLWPPGAAARAPERAGLAWWLALLLPVLVLGKQTYLYYLYAPWAGLCWLLAGALGRVARRLPVHAAAALAAALALGFTAVEWRSVRARERTRVGDLPVDRTVSAGTLLRNAVEGLAAAGVAPGDSVGFVNPYPRAYVDRTRGQLTIRAQAAGGLTYLPFAAALRGGRALAVLRPGVRVLGFEESIPEAWGDGLVFQFENDGRLTPLGRGLDALRAYSDACAREERWDLLEAAARTRIARGERTPDAAYALLYAIAGQGRGTEARAAMRAFVRGFPDDPRSARIDSALRVMDR